MVVAAVVFVGDAALGVDGAAELAAPDDEGFVEQSAGFEVLDEAPGGLVDVSALVGHTPGDVGVVVPVVVVDLDESDASLDHPARQERGVGEGAGFPGIRAVEVVGGLGLAGECR